MLFAPPACPVATSWRRSVPALACRRRCRFPKGSGSAGGRDFPSVWGQVLNPLEHFRRSAAYGALDTSILVLNCENGYVRDNNFWVLGRLIRDQEGSVEIAAASVPLDALQNLRNVSLKIDIFVADPVGGNQGPTIRKAWFLSWVVIAVQHGLAAVPWLCTATGQS